MSVPLYATFGWAVGALRTDVAANETVSKKKKKRQKKDPWSFIHVLQKKVTIV